MGNPRNLVLPTALTIGLVAIAFVVGGPVPAIVFVIAFGGGVLLYVATAWRTQFDPRKVIVPYLLTITLFMVHTYEEYLTDFHHLLSTMAGRDVSEPVFLTVLAWIVPFFWIGGAVALVKRWPVGYYALCASIVTMTIAEFAHFVFPFVVDGTFHYESGMYTAVLPLIPAFYALYVMMREVRAARAGTSHRTESHNASSGLLLP